MKVLTVKRALDLVTSALLLTVSAPIISLLVLLIRVQSPGPGIFRQQRVGRNEKVFTCYKLRTMYVDFGDVPSHEARPDGVTSMGSILRRTKLDELPQLLNVIRGEMSLVGPRPCLPSQLELIQLRRERGVFSVCPGITGLAQIQKVDMSDPLRLAELDQTYVRSRTNIGDVIILLRTLVGAGAGDRIRSGGHPPS